MRPRLPGGFASFLVPLDILHFAHELSWGGLVGLLPLIRDAFNLSYSTSGLLVSAFSLTYGLAQMPMGRLADRMSGRLLIAIGVTGGALATLAIGFSDSYYVITALLIVAATFGGAYHPTANVLISGRFGEGTRGRAVGIHVLGGTSSLLVAPVLAGLLGQMVGWRMAFILLSIPAPLVSLLFLRVVPPESAREEERREAAKTERRMKYRDMLKLVGAAITAAALIRTVSTGVTSFLPLFLVDKRSVAPFLAATMLGFYRGSGLVGAPIGGFLCDRIGRLPLILVALMASGPLLFLITYLPFGFPFILALFGFGAVNALMAPTVQSLIMDSIPRRQIGLVLGIYFFFGSELAGLITPLFGYLIDRTGLENSYSVLAIVAVLAGLVFFMLRNKLQIGNASQDAQVGVE